MGSGVGCGGGGLVGVRGTTMVVGRREGVTVATGVSVASGVAVSSGVGVSSTRGVKVERGVRVRVGVGLPKETWTTSPRLHARVKLTSAIPNKIIARGSFEDRYLFWLTRQIIPHLERSTKLQIDFLDYL